MWEPLKHEGGRLVSAVDEETEQQVIAAVDRLFAGRTRILISHRPSTLAGCDHRLLLQNGHLSLIEPTPAEVNHAG